MTRLNIIQESHRIFFWLIDIRSFVYESHHLYTKLYVYLHRSFEPWFLFPFHISIHLTLQVSKLTTTIKSLSFLKGTDLNTHKASIQIEKRL